MNDLIEEAIQKLSDITTQKPVDWDAFDAILDSLENINVFDAEFEETILSEFILNGGFYHRGANLPDIMRHFLACGYDVTANEGLNGGLVLQSLCWASYDHHILEAAKVLLDAGAPVIYRTRDDDPDEEPAGLLGTLGFKLSGAWAVDKDAQFSNILEAYYAMTEAKLAGKDYHLIDHYLTCFGKPLTAVSTLEADGKTAICEDGEVTVYTEPLVLWFEEKPLVVSCYTDLVVNPVYAEDNKNSLTDVSTTFSPLLGATLQEVEYVSTVFCYLRFSNRQRLCLALRKIDNSTRVGTFVIEPDRQPIDLTQLRIQAICGRDDAYFSNTTTKYQEDSLALECEGTTYLLYSRPVSDDKNRFGICPCYREIIHHYTRLYPFQNPVKTTWFYEEGHPTAARLDFPEGHLYLVTDDYNGIEVWLSDEEYNPLESTSGEGKRIKFQKWTGED